MIVGRRSSPVAGIVLAVAIPLLFGALLEPLHELAESRLLAIGDWILRESKSPQPEADER